MESIVDSVVILPGNISHIIIIIVVVVAVVAVLLVIITVRPINDQISWTTCLDDTHSLGNGNCKCVD